MTHCAIFDLILLRWVRFCRINLEQRCPEGVSPNLATLISEQDASKWTTISPVQYYNAN